VTIPTERTRAVQHARDFLRRLLRRELTPRVPVAVREEARRVLRHFPSDWDIRAAAESAPWCWADPESAEACGVANEPAEHYLLKLTPAQVRVLADACDLYSRIGVGQFEEIDSMARVGMLRRRDDASGAVASANRLDLARKALNAAKQWLLGMAPSESYGIHSPSVHDSFRVAWDLQQVLRHRLAWDDRGNPARRNWSGPNSMTSVHYDEPRATAKEPLASVERASDADLLADLPAGYMIGRSGYGGDQEWHLLRLPEPTPARAASKAAACGLAWVGSGESARSMIAMAKDDTEASAARGDREKAKPAQVGIGQGAAQANELADTTHSAKHFQ
jgi:hypothetical protein